MSKACLTADKSLKRKEDKLWMEEITMKYTSAEANKLLKELETRIENLKSREKRKMDRRIFIGKTVPITAQEKAKSPDRISDVIYAERPSS